MPVYDIEALSFRYSEQSPLVNDALSMSIEEGEIFGLLGANGAGKTTLIKQMVSLLKPTSGTIRLFGQALKQDRHYSAQKVSYMPQRGEALNNLTIDETLYFTAHLRGLSRPDALREQQRLVDLLDLGAIRHKPVTELSGGQRRLSLVATTLAAQRPVWILDEPTNDLDPERRRHVWDILRQAQAEYHTTLILVTHNILEAERMLERVAILKDGKLLALGRVGLLKKQLNQQLRLEIRFTPNQPPQLPEADLVPHIYHESQWHLLIDRDKAPLYLNALNAQSQIEDFILTTPTLEDLYIALMNGDAR